MNVIEWARPDIDKSAWGEGPWQTEPDKVQWTDDTTGLACLAVRHPRSGVWCGYVGVAPDHRFYEVDYNDVDADVHGGLTYADLCQPESDPACGICHIPEPGTPDHLWWLGFDCNHAWDVAPGDYRWRTKAGIGEIDDVYRTLGYVRDQCTQLAAQLVQA